MTRDQELWALALHVERKHGSEAYAFIASRIADLEAAGETGGLKIWRGVQARHRSLRPVDNAN